MPSLTSSVPFCPVCGSSDRVLALVAPDHHFGLAGQHEVWRCRGCGLGQTLPLLSAEEMAAAYPDEYACYHLLHRQSAGIRRRMAATVLAALGYQQSETLPLPAVASRALAAVRCWSWCPPPPPPGRLLDVGCGAGHYGASLIALGWQVDGIEPAAQAAQRARAAGLSVQNATLADAVLQADAYDVVTLWHVLEHLDEPVRALAGLRRALRPWGRLIVETPNWASVTATWARADWYHLDTPRHRVHFTPASMRLALATAGFRIESLQHIPNPHGLAGSAAYRWRRSLHTARPMLAFGWLMGMASAFVGRGDVIRAVARPENP